MLRRRPHEPAPEEATDALVDGDVGFAPGTLRAALRHRNYRIVWTGAFASSIGTWMQNVVLSAFAFELTHSPTFVGIVFFAQLGPSLLLSTVGGVLADSIDRRRLLIVAQLEQLAFSFLLAWMARGANPSRVGIVLCVLAVGAGQALNGPTYSSLLPDLVGREDLPGAVALQSAQMNLSRVIGPAIGGLLYPAFGPAPVFAINALTYLAAMGAVQAVDLPPRDIAPMEHRGWRRLVSGFVIARADPLIRRILLTMTVFSFFSLTFIGLMPALAAENLDMRPRSLAFGLLYAGFGMGAASGALAIGTFLATRPKPALVRWGMVAFSVLLAAFALERNAVLAYPTLFVLGFVYFGVVTSLSTVLQEHLDDGVRGRIMALWIMSFGGTVPLGTLALSPLADHTSAAVVAVLGAIVAAALARYADLRRVGVHE
jgi:MFS family permease